MTAKAPEGEVNEELKQQVSLASDLLAEHRWAQAGEALSVIHLNDKIIEDKERELIACIAQNYSRIKGVERELAGLQLQLKLTSGPKKSALELLRKKIELQNDKVVLSRGKYQAARKIAEAAEETLKAEEAVKDRLCQELNILVQQSAHAQLERLEQLTQRMELLNKGFMPPMDSDLEKPADERQSAVAGTASGGAGEAPPLPSDEPAPQVSGTSGQAGGGEVADQEHSSPAEAPKTPRDQAGERSPSVKSSPGLPPNQRRPELSKADQQKAAAARARHVSLQPKARAMQPNAKPTVNPVQPANSPFRGFD